MTALIRFVIAWFLGIILARWFSLSLPILLPLTLFAGAAIVLLRHNTRQRTAAVLLLTVLLGAGRFTLAQPHISPDHIAFYDDTGYHTFTGVIAAEQDVRDTHTLYRLAAQTITTADGISHPVHGLMLLNAAQYPEFHFGDRVEIRAQPETPPVFEDFSYQDYLARQGILSYARRPRITLLAPQKQFSLRAEIITIKHRASVAINHILPEPEASLLNGILLGIRGGIPTDLYEQFNATGTSHIIVISGSNISLVVALLLLVGQRLIGRKRAVWLAIGGVTLYTVMVGADPAVVRAAVMGGLYVWSMQLGRPNAVRNTLFAAGWLMALLNPLVLWDVGFQLSFMATLGLVALVPTLERLIGRYLSPYAILNEALLVTLAAQIATAPLILYQFGRLSLVSLLANFLIVPVQPLVMFAGAAATAVGMISLPLGTVFSWTVWLPLAWTVAVVRWAARMHGAQITLAHASWWVMLWLYAIIAATVSWLQAHSKRRFSSRGGNIRPHPVALAAVAITLLAVVLSPVLHTLPDGNLHVAFLDVGQGDAVLITTPHGEQMLVDGGPSAVTLSQRLGEEMPFWDHSLDVMVSTHPDSDHLTGLVDTVQRLAVDSVLVSDMHGNSALAKAWRRTLALGHSRVITADAGMRIQLDDGVLVRVLNPSAASVAFPDRNNHSVTTVIQLGHVRFLLSGDLEAPGEAAVLKSGQDVRATVLKSPHHGSNTGSSPAFLDAVSPQMVVISVGADNRFGHPAPSTLERYAERGISVLRTDQLGTVELVTDGARLWMER